MTLSVIIPAHNEAENLRPLLEALVREDGLAGRLHEIIVVDDHSADATAAVAEECAGQDARVRVIRRTGSERGMGFALRDGMQAATGTLIAWVMADRSDHLPTLAAMVDRIEGGDDLVFASRYMPGGSRGELEPLKASLSAGYTVIARWLFGLPVHDITNAYRVFRSELARTIALTRGDFAISPELALKAHRSGFRLGEVPTTYYRRQAGQAKFKMLRMMAVYTWLLRYRFIRTGR